MANQLLRGRLFNPGDTVNADDLNNLVDLATALEGIISSQGSPVSAAGTDQALVLRPGTPNVLKRATVSTFPSGVTSVSTVIDSGSGVLDFSVASPTTTPVFHIGLDSQGPNKVLVGPPSGGGTTPTFRVLTPADVSPLHQDIALATIDWSLGNVFAKVMTGNHTFSFTNVRDGQSIKVRLQYPHTGGPYFAHWDPGILWRGGADPGITASPDAKDIYSFTAIGSSVYGYSDKNFS